MAPQVQSLEEIIAQLTPAQQGQKDYIAGQQALVPGQLDVQKQALEAQRQNQFRDIRNVASRSGNTWSGIPLEEQARYLGEKFLPGLANVDAEGQQRMSALEKALIDLDTQTYNQAFSERTRQQGVFEQYQEAERQRAFQQEMQKIEQAYQAEQARTEREWQERQAAIDRQYTSAQNKANAYVSPATAAQAIIQSIGAKDLEYGNKLSPESFKMAKQAYIQAGGSNKEFMDKYWYLANESHWWDYYY